MLPTFTYQPNCYDNGVFSYEPDGVTCDCCGTNANYYTDHCYAEEQVNALCPACIASGRAAEQFDARFVHEAQDVPSAAATDELIRRTPGLNTWQGEYWLAHCDDYCQFIDYVGTAELEELGIADEAFASIEGVTEFPPGFLRANLAKDGDIAGYLFRCRSCGAFRLWADAS